MSTSVVVGEIDRISGSGNAMLRTDDDEYNLGPLPERAVGDPAIVVPLDGPWAVCLTPYTDKNEYFSKFTSTAGISKEYVEETIREANAVANEPIRQGSLGVDPDEMTEGTIVDCSVSVSGPEASYIIYSDGPPIAIDIPYLPPDFETTVEIVEAEWGIKTATLADTVVAEAPDPGSEIDVEVSDKNDGLAYGVAEGLPVKLPECSASTGDTLRVGVRSVSQDGIEAAVTELPNGQRPSVGDSFELELQTRQNEPVNLVRDKFPWQISSTNLTLDGVVPITVSRVDANKIVAEVDFRKAEVPDLGTELSIEVIEKNGSTCYGLYQSVPVRLPNCPADTGDTLRAGIRSVSQDGIEAAVTELPKEQRPTAGDSFGLNLQTRQDGFVQIVKDNFIWQISSTNIPVDGVIPVTVSRVELNTIIAEVDFERAELPDIGAEFTIEVTEKYGSTCYGFYQSVPVRLPDCAADVGDHVYARATATDKEGILASATAVAETEQLAVGDRIDLDYIPSSSNADTTLIHDGLPILIRAPVWSPDKALPLEVSEIRENTVVAEFDFVGASELDPSVGEQLSLDGLKQSDDILIGEYEGVPVAVPVSRHPNQIPTSLDLVVTGVSPGKLTASIRGHPNLESLDEGNLVTVTIESVHDGDLVGHYREFPVWISYDGSLTPTELTVEITEITDFGIFATQAELPEAAVSGSESIVPARISDSDSSTATAWIPGVVPDPFVAPVSLLVDADFRGGCGAQLVELNGSCYMGTFRTTETGEDVTPVSKYLDHAQSGLLAVRAGDPTKAAAAWEAANKVTDSPVRSIEAVRFAAYARSEASVRDKEFDMAEATVEEFGELVATMDIPTEYVDVLTTEAEIYLELIAASRQSAPDSVAGLQRIAHNISIRPKLTQAVTRLSQLSADTIDRWQPTVPHPYVVERVRELTEQLDSQPDAAVEVFRDAPELQESKWSVPSEADEPRPDETVDVPTIESLPSDTSPVEPVDRDTGGASTDPKSSADTPRTEQTTPTEATSPDPGTSSPETTEDTNGTVDAKTSVEDGSTDNSGQSSNAQDEEQVDDTTTQTGASTSGPLVVDTGPESGRDSRGLTELRREAEAAASDDPVRDTSDSGTTSRYHRAPEIKTYVKARADGTCEACGESAPFETAGGDPYLEAHHVDELWEGGEDHPAKVIALCPTCHKRVHYGKDGDRLNRKLREKLNNGLAEVGSE